MCVPNEIFFIEFERVFLCLGLSLFQVILGLLGISIRSFL